MDDTETTDQRQDFAMTPEPSAPSDTPPHARPYRPFTVNGPYGAHRIYSYRGPWMPPMDYGVGPERVRYMQRLYRFYGLWLGGLFLLIPYLCLLGGRLLAAIPNMSAMDRVMNHALPIVNLVANHYPNSAAVAAAMSINLVVLTLLATLVVGLRWHAYKDDGYSDVSMALYNARWRKSFAQQKPLNNARLAYRVGNHLGFFSLILAAPSIVMALLRLNNPYLNFLDVGIFDGRIFTVRLLWNGPLSFLKGATHSHAALLALMFFQNGAIYTAFVGLLYCGLWPWRRAAYRNDQAYMRSVYADS